MKEIEVTCKLGKDLTADEIQTAAVKALGVSPKMKSQLKYRIVRRSIDARNDILYRYRVEVCKPDENLAEYVLEDYQDVSSSEPVIIIGAGPAGMFAALKLLMRGYKPIILERGKDVHARKFDMAKLSTEGVVNPDSNFCFGEGGAGTFSDGKFQRRFGTVIVKTPNMVFVNFHAVHCINLLCSKSHYYFTSLNPCST